MPQVKALKTFAGRLGLVRTGDRFHADDGYAQALKRNGLIEILAAGAAEPGPERNRNIPTAPGKAGKDETGGQGNQPASPPPTPAGGQALTSSSLQADLASRRKTLPPSMTGGLRKGTPTARKGKAKPKTASTPPGA